MQKVQSVIGQGHRSTKCNEKKDQWQGHATRRRNESVREVKDGVEEVRWLAVEGQAPADRQTGKRGGQRGSSEVDVAVEWKVDWLMA